MRKKEVAVKEETLPATLAGAWGASEAADMDDILIPRILLTQGLSDMVTNGDAKAGEFRDSITGELLGDIKKAMEIIVFDCAKSVAIRVKGGKQTVRIEEITPDFATLPWEFEEGGQTLTRNKVMTFSCLVVNENIKESVPYVLSLSRTSFRAAKQMQTFFQKLRRLDRPSASVVIRVTPEKTENDKGTFYVPSVSIARNSTTGELELARNWYETCRKAPNIRVHDEEDDEPEEGNSF